MTVKQLLASLDSRELTEWRAFLVVEQELDEKNRPKTADELPVGTKMDAELRGYKPNTIKVK